MKKFLILAFLMSGSSFADNWVGLKRHENFPSQSPVEMGVVKLQTGSCTSEKVKDAFSTFFPNIADRIDLIKYDIDQEDSSVYVTNFHDESELERNNCDNGEVWGASYISEDLGENCKITFYSAYGWDCT